MDKPCVYILKNSKTNRYYIGSTINIERRIKQHILGHTRTTRILGTYELVYKEDYDKEDYDNVVDARLREKKLKSYKSKKYLQWLIDNGPVAQR